MPTQQKKRGKTQLRIPSFTAYEYDELDKRRAIVKRLGRRFDELLEQVGATDVVTRERARRVAYLEVAVESYEVASLNIGGEPDGIYVQMINTLEKLYRELGIKPGESKPDLEAHLASKRK